MSRSSVYTQDTPHRCYRCDSWYSTPEEVHGCPCRPKPLLKRYPCATGRHFHPAAEVASECCKNLVPMPLEEIEAERAQLRERLPEAEQALDRAAIALDLFEQRKTRLEADLARRREERNRAIAAGELPEPDPVLAAGPDDLKAYEVVLDRKRTEAKEANLALQRVQGRLQFLRQEEKARGYYDRLCQIHEKMTSAIQQWNNGVAAIYQLRKKAGDNKSKWDSGLLPVMPPRFLNGPDMEIKKPGLHMMGEDTHPAHFIQWTDITPDEFMSQ